MLNSPPLNTGPTTTGNVIHVNFNRDTSSRCSRCGSPYMLVKAASGDLVCGKCL